MNGNHVAKLDIEPMINMVLPESSTHHLSITNVLDYCKSKIINPYLRLLSLMGLRPLIYEQHEPGCCTDVANFLYTSLVVLLMICGYVIQYMACFRRDRGFCQVRQQHQQQQYGELLDARAVNVTYVYEKTCDGSVLFTFITPSVLHLFGYIHAVMVFRGSDDDQLPILMERVFISSANLPNGFLSQKKLVRTLWWFVSVSLIWMLLSMVSVNSMMIAADDIVTFKWLQDCPPYVGTIMKVMLIVCTLWHDIVQASVISNYCLQAHLLTCNLHFLRQKLLQYPIRPLEWMRDIEDFKKMLRHFNQQIAPSVCLFTIVNLSCSIAGLLWLFKFDRIDTETLPVFGTSVSNVILWILISIVPFVQAARLTNACEIIKAVGQEARIRPFVHQDTPAFELDSVLIYASSLKIDARLFYTPIHGKYLCFLVTVSVIMLLVLGQLHYYLL
ncbi:uncharacterized protein LOC126265241 isoform X2 [Aethina tumida]|uniref:uncharacterized protein LOC126265241 isoform X2 n=1 Tax=Aethina tumida TaxID=116153 RepID=UPI0021485FAB|nr:uncharacterized protein LOC126265241 isoform X2 [Aethina tumida]